MIRVALCYAVIRSEAMPNIEISEEIGTRPSMRSDHRGIQTTYLMKLNTDYCCGSIELWSMQNKCVLRRATKRVGTFEMCQMKSYQEKKRYINRQRVTRWSRRTDANVRHTIWHDTRYLVLCSDSVTGRTKYCHIRRIRNFIVDS